MALDNVKDSKIGGKGCFKYGCIIVIIILVLMFVLMFILPMYGFYLNALDYSEKG